MGGPRGPNLEGGRAKTENRKHRGAQGPGPPGAVRVEVRKPTNEEKIEKKCFKGLMCGSIMVLL